MDDFVPVNKDGQPLFCQPFHNEFWVLILEKVWAKIHGSYGKIVRKLILIQWVLRLLYSKALQGVQQMFLSLKIRTKKNRDFGVF